MLSRSVRRSIFGAQVALLGACGSAESNDDGAVFSAGASAGGASAGGPGFGSAGLGGAGSGGAPSAGAGGGASGGSAGTGGGSNASAVPGDESLASIASFLASKTYQSASWVAETPGPRAGTEGTGTPHDRVRVYFNETLVASIAAGNGVLQTLVPHSTGSMAVKELYDETDALVGIAAALKLEGNFQRWAYYCHGPGERCAWGRGPFTEAEPLYGIAGQVDCGLCHGGSVFTAPPN